MGPPAHSLFILEPMKGHNMQYVDDRTEEQQSTHKCLITATDRFMSGWGGAAGGASKCAWACSLEDAEKVLAWVEARSDMKYVNYRGPSAPQWRPKAAHVHIYVVEPGHPALG